MSRGADFGQHQPVVAPGDDVAGAGNADRGFVAATLHGVAAVDFEQLGMQRPSIELENQLGDFWSNGKHGMSSFDFFAHRDRVIRIMIARP